MTVFPAPDVSKSACSYFLFVIFDFLFTCWRDFQKCLHDTGFLDSRLNTSANEEKIAVQFLKHHLLDQRYAKYKATLIVTEVDATLSRRPVAFSSSTMISRWPRFCHDNNLLQEFIRKNDGYDLHHFMATIDEVMSILEPAMSFLDEHRFNILLLNWVEWVVSSSFGPKYAAQAIWDMAHC